jgi:hypothetical protein
MGTGGVTPPPPPPRFHSISKLIRGYLILRKGDVTVILLLGVSFMVWTPFQKPTHNVIFSIYPYSMTVQYLMIVYIIEYVTNKAK